MTGLIGKQTKEERQTRKSADLNRDSFFVVNAQLGTGSGLRSSTLLVLGWWNTGVLHTMFPDVWWCKRKKAQTLHDDRLILHWCNHPTRTRMTHSIHKYLEACFWSHLNSFIPTSSHLLEWSFSWVRMIHVRENPGP